MYILQISIQIIKYVNNKNEKSLRAVKQIPENLYQKYFSFHTHVNNKSPINVL